MPSSLGPAEILVILVVALIVLGPNKLPQAGRQLGKALSEVRRWTSDMKSEIKNVVDFDDRPTYPSSPTPSTTVAADAKPATAAGVPADPEPAPPAAAVNAESGSPVAANPDFEVASETSATAVAETPAEPTAPGPSTDTRPEAPQGDSAQG